MIDIEQCQLTYYPAEILTRRAREVETIDPNLHQLVEKMINILVEKKGIGLAAPQVGVSMRLFIASMDGTREGVKVYINPVLLLSGPVEYHEEGCLSFPGIYVKVKRYKQCQVTAIDPNGHEFTQTVEGLYARCVQHEYDHIEGITLANRMSQTARIVHRRQLKKLEEQLNTA